MLRKLCFSFSGLSNIFRAPNKVAFIKWCYVEFRSWYIRV